MPEAAAKPGRDCPRCPRLADFRHAWREKEPTWFNAPVPSFGPLDARLLIVGLAPGLQGAGVLLYATLTQYKFARGEYGAHPDDGLELVDCRISNAVRCVPPENKPTPAEIKTCRDFLIPTIAEMKNLRAVVALGRIAHESTVRALGGKLSDAAFGHGRRHEIGSLALFCSYHCSRYNTNTGVLTPEMFRKVFAEVRRYLDA